ncbi:MULTISPECIES: hypothetical protein [Vibrio]|uniref:hypothetical protein n=1 Tax=Vibrio TaxID=662 RepID=UPI001CF092F7|nr:MULTISPECIES: hypothetical protein [Vibrio]MDN3628645.1 hypothetical protein [Vibrio lentus]
MKWPKTLVRKMTIKTKVRGTKKLLKIKIQKKRVLKRNPSISLVKRDYPLNSVAQSVCHFIRTRTVAETTLLAKKSHARHVIRHIGDIDISKLTKQRIEEFKMELLEPGVKGKDETGQVWLHPKQFFDDFLGSDGVEHRGPSHTCASLHYNNGVAVAWIAKLLGHRNVSIVEKHYAKFNTKSLKREQIKADNNIKQLFTQTDENSIVVEREKLKPKPKSTSTPSLESLMSLLKMAKTDEQRETIFAVIDIAIAEGGYQ